MNQILVALDEDIVEIVEAKQKEMSKRIENFLEVYHCKTESELFEKYPELSMYSADFSNALRVYLNESSSFLKEKEKKKKL